MQMRSRGENGRKGSSIKGNEIESTSTSAAAHCFSQRERAFEGQEDLDRLRRKVEGRIYDYFESLQ